MGYISMSIEEVLNTLKVKIVIKMQTVIFQPQFKRRKLPNILGLTASWNSQVREYLNGKKAEKDTLLINPLMGKALDENVIMMRPHEGDLPSLQLVAGVAADPSALTLALDS